MIVKVCGMREAENIREVEALGINLMGFIFYEKSKRYCAEVPSYLPTKCKRVGVFVNADDAFIAKRVEAFGLDILQLHGDETPEFVKAIGMAVPGRRIIKALSLKAKADIEKCRQYEGLVDYFLFDTPSPGYGGTGQQFDWSLLSDYGLDTPFLLSGGIGSEDAERIRAFRHLRFAGIDLNSRFELAPALKDTNLLRNFIKKIRI